MFLAERITSVHTQGTGTATLDDESTSAAEVAPYVDMHTAAAAAAVDESVSCTPPEGAPTTTTHDYDENAATDASATAQYSATDAGAPRESARETSCTATDEESTLATASDEAGDTETTVRLL